MPKSRKTSVLRTILVLLAAGTVSCGQMPNDHFSTVPHEEFLTAYEKSNAAKRCTTTKTGCAQVSISGSAVNGSFDFVDSYTTCTKSDSGMSVAIANGTTSSTMRMTLNFYKLSPPPNGSYFCLGPEYSQKTPIYILKEGYCDVRLQVHNSLYTASENESCEVTITSQKPLSGTVECALLSNPDSYLSISKTSKFECAP